ncbi:MAG: SGNH/GDSL hydrolase family protein [Nanobdellota archaeon]
MHGLLKNVTVAVVSLIVICLFLEIALRIGGFVAYPHELHDEDWIQERYVPDLNSYGVRSQGSLENATILIVGDSFTYGYGTLIEHTYPKVIQRRINRTVVNAGYSGWNTRKELQFLQDHMAEFDPELVIVQFLINDLEGYESEQPAYAVAPVYDPSFLVRYSHLYRFLFQRMENAYQYRQYYDYLESVYSEDSPALENFTSDIRKMKGVAEENNVELVFFLTYELVEGYPFRQHYKQVISILDANDISYVDSYGVLQEHDPSILRVSHSDAHPGQEGHRLLASVLVQELDLYGKFK